MRDTLPLLLKTNFPPIRRARLDTVQANLGYRCNQACLHCHVAASPARTEAMDWATCELLLEFARAQGITTLDLTGGAPEMNPHFRDLVIAARELGLRVIDRCNLTILSEPGYETTAQFLADNEVDIVASLPCYLEDNVNRQRGDGVFAASIAGLRALNALGYGQANSTRTLNLVYNPQGPSLPPPQAALEADYKTYLASHYGIVFNTLFALTNMPIQRFGSTLLGRGEFAPYMQRLKDAYRPENLPGVMCRNLISVSWEGYVYDCDFNQMLGLPMGDSPSSVHLRELVKRDLSNHPIRIGEHCYGCTAGQGSSCGGALKSNEHGDKPTLMLTE
jgi:radical SAM/Cys-rich protein